MTAIARSFSIQYGGFTIGGASSNYKIEGPISRSFAYLMESVSCLVIVEGTNRNDMLSKVDAIRAAINRPRRDLVVTLATSVLTFTEGTNAIAISATMNREPSRFDSSSSQAFVVSFDIQKTASDDDDLGLLTYTYATTIAQNGARALAVEASYTQHSGSTAQEVYEAGFDDLLEDIQDAVVAGAEWEEGPRTIQFDRFNQTLKVMVSCVELIYGENAAGTFEPAINDMKLTSIVKYLKVPGAINNRDDPRNIQIDFSATIEKGVSQDLLAIYETIAKPKMLAYAQASSNNPANIYPLDESVQLNPVTNTITAAVIYRVYGAVTVLRSSIEIGYRYTPPAQKIPSYDLDGFGRLRLPGIGSATCMIEQSITVLGDRALASTLMRLLDEAPTRKKFGGAARAQNAKPMSRDVYNELGISGTDRAGWTFEEEGEAFVGPIFNDILGTPLQETSMVRVTLWDLDTDPANLGGALASF